MKKAGITCLILLLLLSLNLVFGKDSMDDSNIKQSYHPIVKPGIDVLLEKQLNLIKGKKVGLITNQTGVTRYLKSTIDALNELPEVDLVALFGPEHGVRGDIPGGETVPNIKTKKQGSWCIAFMDRHVDQLPTC